ncbi:uncharacterized protein LOC113509046 [Trichoplusia ni]|uniref:Uncharacterized protein LOC113509046 n=1 Tax=Trichoplusia ni TaxID=7111 RepID=A0A7E5X5Q4_TRINI|nr:uncharacterized protein LOC113509046 [Trichoplusia ni]
MKLSFVAIFIFLSTVSARHSSTGHGRSHSHSYPHSGGYSGYGTGGSSHQSSHMYPPSTGLSGNTNTGGSVRQTYQQQHNTVQNTYSPRTQVNHHYHYHPPQQISYGSTYHPVYQGHPPVYVYEYRDSGSRFDNLLTGLALYNLGRNSHNHYYDRDRPYTGVAGEVCKLGVSKSTGEYEETRIDCKLMSSFIFEESPRSVQQQQVTTVRNTTVTTTNVTNGNSSVQTVSVKSETVVDALKAKGPSIAVTPGMTCYMIRTFRDTTAMRKPVECGLLQEYAQRSLYRSKAQGLTPVLSILICFVFSVVAY